MHIVHILIEKASWCIIHFIKNTKKNSSFDELMSCIKTVVDWWKIGSNEFYKTIPTRLISMHDCSFGNFIRYAIHHKSTCCFLMLKIHFLVCVDFSSHFAFSLRMCFRFHIFSYTLYSLSENQIKIKFSSSLPSFKLSLKCFPSNWVVKS